MEDKIDRRRTHLHTCASKLRTGRGRGMRDRRQSVRENHAPRRRRRRRHEAEGASDSREGREGEEWAAGRDRARHSSSIAIDIDIVEVNRDMKYVRTVPPPPPNCTNKQVHNHIGAALRDGDGLSFGKRAHDRHWVGADIIKDRDAIMSFISLGSCAIQKRLSGLRPCLCPAGRCPSRWSRPS